MIYISHRMDEIFKITDRITVMRDGEFIKEVKTKDTNLNEIIKLMVGRNVSTEKKEKSNVKKDAETILEVKNLKSHVVKDISFDLKKGEILGFAGLMGALKQLGFYLEQILKYQEKYLLGEIRLMLRILVMLLMQE